jgi:protein-tyrosine phosphatase
VDRLEGEGVKAVLSLASAEEAPLPLGIEEKFAWRRLVLPDHRSERLLQAEELSQALGLLSDLRKYGPVFVHCLAAMERSPLVCLAWLIHKRHLSREQALDYLMQVHPGTNPLPSQLAVLRSMDSFRSL